MTKVVCGRIECRHCNDHYKCDMKEVHLDSRSVCLVNEGRQSLEHCRMFEESEEYKYLKDVCKKKVHEGKAIMKEEKKEILLKQIINDHPGMPVEDIKTLFNDQVRIAENNEELASNVITSIIVIALLITNLYGVMTTNMNTLSLITNIITHTGIALIVMKGIWKL